MSSQRTHRRNAPGSSFDRLLSAIERVALKHEVRGNHIQFECPTHSDTKPSVSADYKPEAGQTLVRCHAGCAGEDVVDALHLTFAMLYDDWLPEEQFKEHVAEQRSRSHSASSTRSSTSRTPAAQRKPAATRRSSDLGKLPSPAYPPKPLGRWELVATYDYSDAEGVVVHRQNRMQRTVELTDPLTGQTRTSTEKQFRQQWPDPTADRWLTKTPSGFEPVLYRLPDVVAWIHQGVRIWLCEGEKDAERLIELGEGATTNPAGATNFKDSQAEALRGARVVVPIDHDAAGYRRGIRLLGLLADHATEVWAVLPRVDELHADVSDHLDAGHGVNDFLEVDLPRLRQLEKTAVVEDLARKTQSAFAEAAARLRLAHQAGDDEDQATMARRWVAEADTYLTRAVEHMEAAAQRGIAEDLQQRMNEAIAASCAAVREIHTITDERIGEDIEEILQVGEPTEADADPERIDEDGVVVDHPTRHGRFVPIPMSRGSWSYRLGGPQGEGRGVFQYLNGEQRQLAPLPFIHARIISRDGYGRPTGTYYLVSAEPDSIKVMIGQDELSRHTWPNILGLPVSFDERILKAASTAIIAAAYATAPEVEGTPRVSDDGRIELPVLETLPHGYLATSQREPGEALGIWGQLVQAAAESPRLALVLGASAFAPFVAALDAQPHIVSLHGEMAQGKSVAMRTAASMWGHPGSKSMAGVCASWNLSKLAPTSFLGELGVLPAFFDEIGQAGNLTTEDWNKRIFDICEGASRGRPQSNGRLGFTMGRSWYGILFSAGNGRLMDGQGAGTGAGTIRRVVELPAPFTNDEAHSALVESLYPQAYGHLGRAIIDRYDADSVRPLVAKAVRLVGPMPVNGSRAAHELLKHLHAHVAGAVMVDEICGTGSALTNAAVLAVREFFDEWEEPQHDADRILEYLSDSLVQEPGSWPTVEQYLEAEQPPGDQFSGSVIAQRGIDRNRKGFIANDESWVAVISTVWKAMCADLAVDSDVACRELVNRGALVVQRSKKGDRNNQAKIRIGTKTFRLYKIAFSALDPGEDHDVEQPPAPSGPTDVGTDESDTDPSAIPDQTEQLQLAPTAHEPEHDGVPADEHDVPGGVPAPVPAATPPVTCTVPAVPAVPAPPSRTEAREGAPTYARAVDDRGIEQIEGGQDKPNCVICGVPVGQLVHGVPLHIGPCLERFESQQPDAKAVTPSPTPESSKSPAQHEKPAGRWRSPVAVFDAELIYLPEGVTEPWPRVQHLGDLALLADRLRLGHGGGEVRPEEGQLWLTSPAVLERLGFPGELELPEDFDDLTRDEARKATLKAIRPYLDLPVVADALEAGWELGQDRLDTWTYLRHPEVFPRGVRLIFVPWMSDNMRDTPLLNGAASVAELADNLADFAQATGVQFHIHSGVTAMRLINNTRPQRATEQSISGTNAARVAVVREMRSELPPFYRDQRDDRFDATGHGVEGSFHTLGVENDYSWWRPFGSLLTSERECEFVHSFDRSAHYWTEWHGADLGVDGLTHLTGADARWDGREERAGLWLVHHNWGAWPAPMMPEPRFDAIVDLRGRVESEEDHPRGVWLTTPSLKGLAKVGITPTIVEAYRWHTSGRYLDKAADRIQVARGHANPAVVKAAKAIYTTGTGTLARKAGMFGSEPLWRPDWYDHIRAGSRLKLLITLLGIHKATGMTPLAVHMDSIVFASSERDPIKAWPGDPAKLGKNPGYWAPEASGLLAEWGPRFLIDRKPGQEWKKGGEAMESLISHKRGEQW